MVFAYVHRPRTPTRLLSDMNEADWQGFPAITHVTREARDIRPRHYTPLANESFIITLREKRDRSGNNLQCTGLEVQASKEKVLWKARH